MRYLFIKILKIWDYYNKDLNLDISINFHPKGIDLSILDYDNKYDILTDIKNRLESILSESVKNEYNYTLIIIENKLCLNIYA